jgi:cation diffusion facilitator family transporter
VSGPGARILDWFGFGRHGHDHGRHDHGGHDHGGHGPHGHIHGVIDATIATTDRGIWAIKWSFVILAVTAALQMFVVFLSGSVALLADTIHNIGDATTAIPLWIAFMLARRKPSPTFTYGLGRVEDLAGIVIVLIILFSAIVAGYEAIDRLINPRSISFLGWVAAAGLIGFVGNEAVAVFRIRVGREINSAALIADGYHARTDGLTSLAVVIGAVGVWLGFPLADPIVGLLITIAIFGIVWQSARSVLTRMLDGIEPGVMAEIRHAAEHVPGARIVEAKARWIGHRLHADIVISADETLPLSEASKITAALEDELFEHMPALAAANVRFSLGDHDHPRPHGHHHGHGDQAGHRH